MSSGRMRTHQVPLVPSAGAPTEYLKPQDILSLLCPAVLAALVRPGINLETPEEQAGRMRLNQGSDLVLSLSLLELQPRF